MFPVPNMIEIICKIFLDNVFFDWNTNNQSRNGGRRLSQQQITGLLIFFQPCKKEKGLRRTENGRGGFSTTDHWAPYYPTGAAFLRAHRFTRSQHPSVSPPLMYANAMYCKILCFSKAARFTYPLLAPSTLVFPIPTKCTTYQQSITKS